MGPQRNNPGTLASAHWKELAHPEGTAKAFLGDRPLVGKETDWPIRDDACPQFQGKSNSQLLNPTDRKSEQVLS